MKLSFSSSSTPSTPRKPYKVGLALSGGGARGFAHLGALKALADCGIAPDIVAGVSAGSVVAAFHGAGLSTAEALDVFHNTKFKSFVDMVVPRRGFFNIRKFGRIIEEACGVNRIEDLRVPTIICATDFDEGTPVSFESGPLAERVAASCCIPIVFEPVEFGGHHYVDGGVLHNLPAWALRDKCETLIGISCSPMPDFGDLSSNGIVEIARRSFMLMTKSNIYPDLALCDVAIELSEVADHSVFEIKDLEILVEKGYLAALRALRAQASKL